jgi:hypothetical protein
MKLVRKRFELCSHTRIHTRCAKCLRNLDDKAYASPDDQGALPGRRALHAWHAYDVLRRSSRRPCMCPRACTPCLPKALGVWMTPIGISRSGVDHLDHDHNHVGIPLGRNTAPRTDDRSLMIPSQISNACSIISSRPNDPDGTREGSNSWLTRRCCGIPLWFSTQIPGSYS